MSDGGGRDREHDGSGGFLGWIERVGNKVPHPAIIFLGLIVGVIVLSAVLAWAGRQRDDRGRRARAVRGRPRLQRRRVDVPLATSTRPSEAVPDYEIVTETIEVKSLLSGDGIRSHVHHRRAELQRLRRGRGDPGRDDRRRRRRGGRADRRADPQDGAGRARPARSPSSSCCSAASRASPPTPGYLVLIPLGAAAFASLGRQPARRHRRGVRRRQRGVLRQHPDHPGRRHHHRGHQRDHGRRRAQRRAAQRHAELLLLDRLDDLLRDRDDVPHREVRRAAARARGTPPSGRPTRRSTTCPSGDELAHEARGLRLAGIYTLVAIVDHRAADRSCRTPRCATPTPARSSATRRS